jgi:hypothetical protein
MKLFNGKIVSHEVGEILMVKIDFGMQLALKTAVCWVGMCGGHLDLDPEDDTIIVVSKGNTQGCDTQGCLRYMSSMGTLS